MKKKFEYNNVIQYTKDGIYTDTCHQELIKHGHYVLTNKYYHVIFKCPDTELVHDMITHCLPKLSKFNADKSSIKTFLTMLFTRYIYHRYNYINYQKRKECNVPYEYTHDEDEENGSYIDDYSYTQYSQNNGVTITGDKQFVDSALLWWTLNLDTQFKYKKGKQYRAAKTIIDILLSGRVTHAKIKYGNYIKQNLNINRQTYHNVVSIFKNKNNQLYHQYLTLGSLIKKI